MPRWEIPNNTPEEKKSQSAKATVTDFFSVSKRLLDFE